MAPQFLHLKKKYFQILTHVWPVVLKPLAAPGVYEQTGSAGAGLLIWALAGLIAILATYCYSELGTMIEVSVTTSYPLQSPNFY